MTTRQAIDGFLACKRIAVVGVSRNPKDFSRVLFAEFRRRGYEVSPVCPKSSEIDGIPCFARVQDVPSRLQAAVLLTNPTVTGQVVRDCVEAGIRRVWMYRASGAGAVSESAVAFCQSVGIQVVPGECPFMFFPQTGPLHRIHGCLRRLTGRYPR